MSEAGAGCETAGFVTAVVQWAPGDDPAANVTGATGLIDRAADAGAYLIVLPEYSQFTSGDMKATAAGAAEPLDGPFVTALSERAAALDLVVMAGFLERSGSSILNTVVAVGPDGPAVAYRKVHLYDAFGARESDWLDAGDPQQLPVVDVRGVRVGLQTCYDLRFPEVSRRLVDAGAEVLAIPAQWARGPQKEQQWSTLLAARAIESTAYVVAAGQAPPIGVGCSAIIDPSGVSRAALGGGEGIACAPIEPALVASVRATNPSLDNRRYSIASAQ